MAYEVKAHLNIKVSTSLLREAITTPSAQMVVDYERLELLGGTFHSYLTNSDSFLKTIATCGVFLDHPEKHEGLLHALRIKIICNKFLRARAKRYYQNCSIIDVAGSSCMNLSARSHSSDDSGDLLVSMQSAISRKWRRNLLSTPSEIKL